MKGGGDGQRDTKDEVVRWRRAPCDVTVCLSRSFRPWQRVRISFRRLGGDVSDALLSGQFPLRRMSMLHTCMLGMGFWHLASGLLQLGYYYAACLAALRATRRQAYTQPAKPPSTRILVPVTNELSALRRYTAAAATSSGLPLRLRLERSFARSSIVVEPAEAVRGVSMTRASAVCWLEAEQIVRCAGRQCTRTRAARALARVTHTQDRSR